MNRNEREQARRVAVYADGVVTHRRNTDVSPEALSREDREFESFRELIQTLSEVDIAGPTEFQDQLRQRLLRSDGAVAKNAPWQAGLPRVFGKLRGPLRRGVDTLLQALPIVRIAGLGAAVAIAILVLVRSVVNPPIVSAKEIASRSDAALATLVHPEQLLYRQWNVTSIATTSEGVETRRTRAIHEWMDGADFDRVAGRWLDAAGRLQIAYATQGADHQHRPKALFSPGVYGEPNGVMNIEPTREEYEAAVRQFPPSRQRALEIYLTRQYIYEPIIGERRFNRAIIEAPDDAVPNMPRIVVSSDATQTLNRTPVYVVRVVDPASITFNWRSEGPPNVRLAAAEFVRYIGRVDYLTVRTEEHYLYENGDRRFVSRELVNMRTVSSRGLNPDPFTIDVPPGTPVQQQSAFEQLSGVANVQARVPTFVTWLRNQQPTWPAAR